MIVEAAWLIKLLLAHLLTDFVLQPSSWVTKRREKHFASPKLYLHGLVTATLAWLLIGWHYWPIALIILLTHIVIDGWKSYQKDTASYFIFDQALHLSVILGCWFYLFVSRTNLMITWEQLYTNTGLISRITAFVFVTFPSGIIIGQLTKQWREKIKDPVNSLANAGKWIGIAERVIVLILVIHHQYAAIGLLITAKGIIRFGEKDREEIKTEYLVLGTLLSIGLAIITGLMIN
ncbi:MAG: DUF3307 domain-containing protein [Chitinophagaceae bacterium]|nr:DUF3307 domain-containing protein [Chitinophagaceae bacterium]